MEQSRDYREPVRSRYAWMEHSRFADFLEDRGIAPEDYELVDCLVKYPGQEFILMLHNHFNSHKERSLEELGYLIQDHERRVSVSPANADEKMRLDLLKDFLKFAEKYDWAACLNLERILEAEGP